jgi:hypothetical protein
MGLEQTLVIYLLIGVGVAVAVYVSGQASTPVERAFGVLTAVPFWPLYVPILLCSHGPHEVDRSTVEQPPQDEMTAAIDQVDAELEAALNSLDGWAEDVLAREKDRIHELRKAWSAQSERIREMDRLLALPDYAGDAKNGSPVGAAAGGIPLSAAASDRLRRSQQVRQQNIDRLRQVRRRAYEDLMGTLAWVRELVSMIHLAKFTGAPASRAEELVAQIAAAVEGLSALTWQDEMTVSAADST